MRIINFSFLTLCTLVTQSILANPHIILANKENKKNECVILLHGLGRSYTSFEGMQKNIAEAGYHTVNYDYPSRDLSVKDIALKHFSKAIDACNEFKPNYIHIVTHSLGGIVTRYALKDAKPKNLGKVVMLSPPNKGSEVADYLKGWAIYQWLNGPAGQEMTTDKNSLPLKLGPATFTVGIITGKNHTVFDHLFSDLIPGESDGKVSVESAKLEGMKDFLVVNESHTFIMDSSEVLAATLNFFESSLFFPQLKDRR